MLGEGINPTPGLPQLFVKREDGGAIILVIAKVVDDFLVCGPRPAIENFNDEISKRFKVGRFVVGRDLIFNRLHIHQEDDHSVKITMSEYLESIKPLEISKGRRKEQDSICTPGELTSYLGLAGSLNFLGHGTLPQAAFAASHLQQQVGRLCVSNLVTANKVLREVKALIPSIIFRATTRQTDPSYLCFSDASTGSSSYGQTGYISGIYLPAGGESVYHALDWVSCKQSRVSFSSIGAEILAAATSTDRGSLMAERLQVLYNTAEPLPFVLTVDSHGLYSTVTILHEGSDYRLRPTVARMRDSFEIREISVMQWIPGKQNLADALTKRNTEMYSTLNKVMSTGFLSSDVFRSAEREAFTSS